MDGQHSWAVSERSRTSSISSLNSIDKVSIYNIVGRTWMTSIPGLSLRDKEPPAYPVSIVSAKLISL